MCSNLISNQRITDPTVYIIVSLLDGPKHGYAIQKDIENSFGMTIGYGTLYGCIKRLKKRNLIEAANGKGRAQPYILTSQGMCHFESELSNLIALTLTGYRRHKELAKC